MPPHHWEAGPTVERSNGSETNMFQHPVHERPLHELWQTGTQCFAWWQRLDGVHRNCCCALLPRAAADKMLEMFASVMAGAEAGAVPPWIVVSNDDSSEDGEEAADGDEANGVRSYLQCL